MVVPLAILIAVPVLRRPHRVQPLLQSIRSATTGPYRVLFIANEGDRSEIAAIRRSDADLLVQPYPHHPSRWRERPGEWAVKLNRVYRESSEPLIFCGADDIEFHPGWADAVRARVAPGVGLIGTNDMHNPRVIAGEHATHFVFVRGYVDRYGTIDEPRKMLHEGYAFEHCDDEAIATAKARGAWVFAEDAKVEHLHANYGLAPVDPLYAQQNARMVASRRLFDQRRRLWGGDAA